MFFLVVVFDFLLRSCCTTCLANTFSTLPQDEMINLTNRFHFAVRLYSDNAQMTSKRGENKEVRYEPQASSVTNVLTTF